MMQRAAPVGWFLAWIAVGAAWSLSFLSFIGVLTILPTIGATLLLGLAGKHRDGAVGLPGLAVGAGVLPLYVAYLNRAGPGMQCRANASGGEDCVEHLTPLPWLGVGLVLVVVGLVAFAVASHRHPVSAAPPPAAPLGWFAAWLLIGAAWPLAVLGGFGLFTVPLVLVATIVAGVEGRGRHGAVGLPGVLVGLGLVVAVIAQHRHSLPWLGAGLALVAVGLTVFTTAWRISSRRHLHDNVRSRT